MSITELPTQELERLTTLRSYQILYTGTEKDFDGTFAFYADIPIKVKSANNLNNFHYNTTKLLINDNNTDITH